MAPVGQWLEDRYGLTVKEGNPGISTDWSDKTVKALAGLLQQLPSEELQGTARGFLRVEAEALQGSHPGRAAALMAVVG